MVSTKTLVTHLTLVLAVLFCSLDLSKANQQCRSRAMNYVMTQCSDFGGRGRRDLTEDLPNIGTDSGESWKSEYRTAVNRHPEVDPSRAVAGMPYPKMHDTISGEISGAYHGYQSQIPGRFGFASVPRAHPGRPQYFVSAPAPPPSYFQPESRFNKGFLPQASGDDLGFDLTSDELDELVDEISNKISRHFGMNSEKMKRDVLQAAMKCCQNETTCKEMCQIGVF